MDERYLITVSIPEGETFTGDSGNYHTALDMAYRNRYAYPLAAIKVVDTNQDTSQAILDLPTPVVGALATFSIGSDSYAGHITKVTHKGRRIGFAHEGSERQSFIATLRANGRYRPQGESTSCVHVGFALNKRDPSF